MSTLQRSQMFGLMHHAVDHPQEAERVVAVMKVMAERKTVIVSAQPGLKNIMFAEPEEVSRGQQCLPPSDRIDHN